MPPETGHALRLPALQIIGIVVADTEAHARAAAKAVAIEYEELPAIISIDDAIEAGSYYEVHSLVGQRRPALAALYTALRGCMQSISDLLLCMPHCNKSCLRSDAGWQSMVLMLS